jgi:hypothetical protein
MSLMLTMTITDAYIKLSAASHSSVRANTLLISGKRNNPGQKLPAKSPRLQWPSVYVGHVLFRFVLLHFTSQFAQQVSHFQKSEVTVASW